MATFLADQSTLDNTSGGFDISDTAANITANLDQLNDPNIDAIIVSDNGQVGASVQQLTTDAAAIGKLFNQNGAPCQLAISDTAADITAGLNGLNGSHIASITISDNGAIGVSVAQLTSDAAAISKLANQSGTAYQLAVTVPAADITAALDSLNGSNIASITIPRTTTPSRIGCAADERRNGDLQARQRQRDALSAGGDRYGGRHHGRARFPRRLEHRLDHDLGQRRDRRIGCAADERRDGDLQARRPERLVLSAGGDRHRRGRTAALDSLDGSNIGSITISDNGAIGVSVAQLTSDATAISAARQPERHGLSVGGDRYGCRHHGRSGFPRRLEHRLDHDLGQRRDRRIGCAADERRDGDLPSSPTRAARPISWR